MNKDHSSVHRSQYTDLGAAGPLSARLHVPCQKGGGSCVSLFVFLLMAFVARGMKNKTEVVGSLEWIIPSL